MMSIAETMLCARRLGGLALDYLLHYRIKVYSILENVRLPEHRLGPAADFGNARCRASY